MNNSINLMKRAVTEETTNWAATDWIGSMEKVTKDAEDTYASTEPNLHFHREMGKTNDIWIRPWPDLSSNLI